LIGRLNVGQGGLVPRGWSRRGATRFRNRLASRAPMAPPPERCQRCPPERWTSAEPTAGSGVPLRRICTRGVIMNGIIYLVGLIVIIMFILSFLGLR
jgi:hypothetical protein